MQNIKLILGYDGTSYHGFQFQQNAVTVQEKIEEAIKKVMGQSLRVTAAGRTDTGVHATGQVINFSVDTRIPLERIPHALNTVLPRDIVIYSAQSVSDSFHARYDAKGKCYTYTIDNGRHPQVLTRHHTFHVRHPLDVTRMKQAAATLVGTHDFTSFMASGSSVKTTVRNLCRLDVEATAPYLTITAEADGFLYNMVRIITGTLIEVGRGKRHADLSPIIAAQNRYKAGWTVPPRGLVLRNVEYDEAKTTRS